MSKLVVLSALVLASALAVAPAPAGAQSPQPGLGGVLDTLSDILGVGRGRVTGHVVHVEGQTMIFRTSDRRTVRVDLSGLSPEARARLRTGAPATVTLRRTSDPQLPAAAEVEVQPGAPDARFGRLDGTVERVWGSQVVVRSREGVPMTLDASGIVGVETLQPGQPATVFYEQGATAQPLTALLIESRAGIAAGPPAGFPSASVPGTAGGQVHGRVSSVGLSSMTLDTFEGRQVVVDITQIDPQVRRSITPGDVVTAFGSQRDATTFVATWLQRPAR